MRKSFLKAVPSAVLLCLLIAEAMAVVHSLDFDAHPAGEACKICISAAGFGGAAPAKEPAVPPPSTAPFDAVAPDAIEIHARVERPPARGPPQAS